MTNTVMSSAVSDIGGHVVLDFCNTTGGQAKARDEERLRSPAELTDWAVRFEMIDEAERSAPDLAPDTRALAALRDRREALHAVLSAHAAGRRPLPDAPLAAVAHWIAEARSRAVLAEDGSGLDWRVKAAGSGAALISDRLALLADDLLRGPMIGTVRECERCSWLFVSAGRGRPRRWCSMATCGNREKAARHYARKKAD